MSYFLQKSAVRNRVYIDSPTKLENPSPNLSPARREALNFPPSLVGKGVRGLGHFPYQVGIEKKSAVRNRVYTDKTRLRGLESLVGCVMDASPNAPQISGGALACGVTHPTKLLAPQISGGALCWRNNAPYKTTKLENPSPNLSPARREALNFPPSLRGKGVRGLGHFPHQVRGYHAVDG